VRLHLGVTLPTFTADPRLAVRAAAVAEAERLDGVFAFDHLWPLGRPDRPAMWSFGVLGAVAAATRRLCIGPLVARVGLLDDADLIAAVGALASIAGPTRVVAAVGVGDHMSAAENRAYGAAFGSVADRTAELERVARALVAAGITTWIGGTSTAVAETARSVAETARSVADAAPSVADAGPPVPAPADSAAGDATPSVPVARNLWAATVEEVAAAAATVPVTWAGQVLVGRDAEEIRSLRNRFAEQPGLVSGTADEVAAHLAALHAAGAGWCVCTPLDYLVRPVEAVKSVCLVRRAVT
jgi:hypothetical protein